MRRSRSLISAFRRFCDDRRGNVALIFAVSLIPIAIAAGVGLDFSRALMVRSELSEALDAAGLAVGSEQSLSTAQLQSLAQAYFNINFKLDSSFGKPSAVKVTRDPGRVTLTASVLMPTTLMIIAAIKAMPISFTSTIVWGQTKLWVALVLDNTGSMTETDSTGTSKISALKTATHNLLTMLQNASANPGDVEVSIVPFTKDVNVGNGYSATAWLDWTDWNAANGKQNCGWGGGNSGWGGSGWGYFNQGQQNNHGKGCTWSYDHTKWNGCITDRTQNYDTMNTTPVASNPNTLFPTEQYSYCPLALLPLTDDWTALSTEVDNMYAGGNTNQTIGFVWGWQSLTDGDPLNPGSLPKDTQQVIILLSDGLNTQNRWTTDQSSIDAREKLACDNAKAAGVTICTVFVDLNGTQGSSTALQYCASSASKYFDLTNASSIIATFQDIGTQITHLRVSQ